MTASRKSLFNALLWRFQSSYPARLHERLLLPTQTIEGFNFELTPWRDKKVVIVYSLGHSTPTPAKQ
jgi:hypothetical protein